MSEPSTLQDIDGGTPANAGTASAPSPEQAVAHTQLLQFRHWWNSSFARRRAGEAVSRMWHDYPFGALILDESWAWWSLSKVIVEGQLQAKEVGHPLGLVVASAVHGVAVLDWPDGPGEAAWIHLVAYQALQAGASESGEGRARLSPERFLSAKGFDRPDAVVACAFCEHQPKGWAQLAQTESAEACASGAVRPGLLPDPASYRSRRAGTAAAPAPRAHSKRQTSRALA